MVEFQSRVWWQWILGTKADNFATHAIAFEDDYIKCLIHLKCLIHQRQKIGILLISFISVKLFL